MGQYLAGYLKLFHDCNREIETPNSYHISLIDDIISTELDYLECVCVTLFYDLYALNGRKEKTAAVIALDINNSLLRNVSDKALRFRKDWYDDDIVDSLKNALNYRGLAIMDAEHVTQILADAIKKISTALSEYNDKAKIELKWLAFSPKTQTALNRSRFRFVCDIFEFEQKLPLTKIDGINTERALEIYSELLSWYQEKDFKHYQKTLELSEYDPYLELICDVFDRPAKFYPKKIPNFARSNIDEAIKSLTSTEALAIRKRYGLDSGYKMTYQKLADCYLLISYNQTHLIVEKGLRKLRHLSYSKHFDFLIKSREELIEDYIEVQNLYDNAAAMLEEARRIIRGMNHMIESSKDACSSQHTDCCPLLANRVFIPEQYTKTIDEHIEVLELSPRPYNCLKRAHINTIGGILERKKSGLLKIYSMGPISINEIVQKLGKRFPEDDPIWIDFMDVKK